MKRAGKLLSRPEKLKFSPTKRGSKFDFAPYWTVDRAEQGKSFFVDSENILIQGNSTKLEQDLAWRERLNASEADLQHYAYDHEAEAEVVYDELNEQKLQRFLQANKTLVQDVPSVFTPVQKGHVSSKAKSSLVLENEPSYISVPQDKVSGSTFITMQSKVQAKVMGSLSGSMVSEDNKLTPKLELSEPVIEDTLVQIKQSTKQKLEASESLESEHLAKKVEPESELNEQAALRAILGVSDPDRTRIVRNTATTMRPVFATTQTDNSEARPLNPKLLLQRQVKEPRFDFSVRKFENSSSAAFKTAAQLQAQASGTYLGLQDPAKERMLRAQRNDKSFIKAYSHLESSNKNTVVSRTELKTRASKLVAQRKLSNFASAALEPELMPNMLPDKVLVQNTATFVITNDTKAVEDFERLVSASQQSSEKWQNSKSNTLISKHDNGFKSTLAMPQEITQAYALHKSYLEKAAASFIEEQEHGALESYDTHATFMRTAPLADSMLADAHTSSVGALLVPRANARTVNLATESTASTVVTRLVEPNSSAAVKLVEPVQPQVSIRVNERVEPKEELEAKVVTTKAKAVKLDKVKTKSETKLETKAKASSSKDKLKSEIPTPEAVTTKPKTASKEQPQAKSKQTEESRVVETKTRNALKELATKKSEELKQELKIEARAEVETEHKRESKPAASVSYAQELIQNYAAAATREYTHNSPATVISSSMELESLATNEFSEPTVHTLISEAKSNEYIAPPSFVTNQEAKSKKSEASVTNQDASLMLNPLAGVSADTELVSSQEQIELEQVVGLGSASEELVGNLIASVMQEGAVKDDRRANTNRNRRNNTRGRRRR